MAFKGQNLAMKNSFCPGNFAPCKSPWKPGSMRWMPSWPNSRCLKMIHKFLGQRVPKILAMMVCLYFCPVSIWETPTRAQNENPKQFERLVALLPGRCGSLPYLWTVKKEGARETVPSSIQAKTHAGNTWKEYCTCFYSYVMINSTVFTHYLFDSDAGSLNGERALAH